MKKVRKHVWDLLFLERLVFHFLSSGGLSNLNNQVVFPAQLPGWSGGIQAEIRVYSD